MQLTFDYGGALFEGQKLNGHNKSTINGGEKSDQYNLLLEADKSLKK